MKRALFLSGVLIGLVVGAIGSVAIQSHAEPQVELLLGRTKFNTREMGTWQQDGPSAETKNGLLSSSYLIGLKDTFEPGGYFTAGYRFGYTRLGEYSGQNWASVHDQDDHQVLTERTCDPVTARYCPALYKGSGRAQGVYFGPTIERSWGGLSVIGEAGALLYRSTYDVSVYHPYDNLFVPKGNSYEYNRATGDHFTWYWGLGSAYKIAPGAVAVLIYREYWDVYQQGDASRGGDVGLTGGRARQILAGLSVAF